MAAISTSSSVTPSLGGGKTVAGGTLIAVGTVLQSITLPIPANWVVVVQQVGVILVGVGVILGSVGVRLAISKNGSGK